MSPKPCLSVFFAVQVSVFLCSSAGALELKWASGSARKNLVQMQAAQCTLLVATGPGERAPDSWRLVWEATGDSKSPITIIPAGASPTAGDVCSLIPASNVVEQLSHAATAQHCAPFSSGGDPIARYVLQIDGGVAARLRIVTLADSASPATFSPDSISTNEVTINGRSALALSLGAVPPVVSQTDFTRQGGRISFVVSGWHLDAIQSADYRSGDGTQTIPLQLKTIRPSRLVVTGIAPATLADGYIRMESSRGSLALSQVVREPDSTRTDFARDRLIIRFAPSALSLPYRDRLANLTECGYSSNALRDSMIAAGMRGVRAALPLFTAADVHTRNANNEDIVLDDLTSLCVVQCDPALDPRDLRKRIAKWPGVLYAELDKEAYTYLVPNDPLYGQQWGLHGTSQSFCGFTPSPVINLLAESPWSETQGSASVNVAFLDTGVDSTQADLHSSTGLERVRYGPSFDPDAFYPIDGTNDAHGTAVMGIACGTGNNSIGVAGVAWKVVPWAVKVFNDSGLGYASWIMAGIDWARSQHIPIVSLSGGSLISPVPLPPETLQAELAVCLNARLAGVLVVAASGNAPLRANGDIDHIPVYPAAADQRVCAVGAIGAKDGTEWRDDDYIANGWCLTHDSQCFASNYGPSWLDLVGPGGRFTATTMNQVRQANTQLSYYEYLGCKPGGPTSIFDLDTLSSFSGTSAATPFVSGAAALLLSQRPSLNGEDLEQILKLTAYNPRNPAGFDVRTGWGVPRLTYAFSYVDPRLFAHWQAGASPPQGLSGSGSFADTDSQYVQRTFVDVPQLGVGPITRNCWRHRLTTQFLFPVIFTENPLAWATAYGSVGWKDTTTFDYNYEVPWGKLSSLGMTSVTITTYVYKFPDTTFDHVVKWLPTDPTHARVAFTAAARTSQTTSVDGSLSSRPLRVRATPNPARGATWISFTIPTRGRINLEIFDASGRLVRSLGRDALEAGSYRVPWDGRSDRNQPCSPGLYFCRLKHESAEASGSLILLSNRP